ADGVARADDELWAIVKRTVDSNEVRYVEQFQPLDWGPDPNYCWFVDCAGWGTSSAGGDETLTQGIEDYNYAYTLLSDNGYFWAIPVSGRSLTTIDADAAVNVGGGIVGIPCTGNPFESGAVVYIEGTTNYENAHTLTAGTTTSQLQFAATYTAETFDGNETVVRAIDLEVAGNGSAVQTDAGVFYYGHAWTEAKASIVSALDANFIESIPTLSWLGTENWTTNAADLQLSDDQLYLYVLSNPGSRVYRFRLSDGALMWSVSVSGAGYKLAIDDTGNAYVGTITGGIQQLAVADGTVTQINDTTRMYLHIELDSDLDILVGAGYQYDATSNLDPENPLYNLAVRKLDNSGGDQVCVGGTYINGFGKVTQTRIIAKGCLALRDSYIYVLIQIGSPASSTIYKYYWTGSELTFIDSAAGPDYGIGLFFDPWGNLVVVNQDYVSHQDDLLWFYDDNLNYLSKCENFYSAMLLSWDGIVGGIYIQGNYFFGGEGEAAAAPEDVNDNWSGLTWGVGLAECVYADGRPLDGTYTVDVNGVIDLGAEYDVVIAGLNYYSILETMPLTDAETIGRPCHVKNIAVDFIETMGAHVGADMENSSDWTFSDDDFATSMQPFTGYKPQMGYTRFSGGTGRTPVVYIYEWDPVPMTIRSITANLEVTVE
ncbi:MAG: hypothetical protein V2B18_25355, partial [Pseudomonadota bacterium]